MLHKRSESGPSIGSPSYDVEQLWNSSEQISAKLLINPISAKLCLVLPLGEPMAWLRDRVMLVR